jgi:hypothetical protein
MRGTHFCDLFAQTTESIDESTMKRRIDQSTIVMLSVNLDEFACNGPQDLRTHRLIIDESARTPIGHLYAPQDKVTLARNILRFGDSERGMALREIEDGDDLALAFAMAHERAIAARAERKRKSIEKNGFASARLTGQDREAGPKFEIEPVDQNNIPDGEVNEHGV